MQKSERKRIARTNLEDSYIKRLLRKKKGLMAKDCTSKIIEETRESIKALRRKKRLAKKLLADGKYKCSRCFVVKTLDMFYKDSSKKCGFNRACKKCVSVNKKASKKYNKRIRENLEDVYIKRALYRDGVKLEDVTSKMIINKRKSIQTKRDLLKTKKDLLKKNKKMCPSCNKIKRIKTFSKENYYCKKCHKLKERERVQKYRAENIGRIIPADYIKKCLCCKKTKKSIYFYRGNTKKDGLSRFCKDCDYLKGKKYKPNASEKTKENRRIWAREYRLKNAERIRERQRLYRLNNPEVNERRNKRERIKRREEFLIAINTCNDCNVELGLKKDTKGVRVCDNCEMIRKRINNEKNKERVKNYTEEQKLEIRKKQNKRMKEKRDNLDDSYIKNQLCSGGILKSKDIPKELIEAKREQLKLKRFLEKK